MRSEALLFSMIVLSVAGILVSSSYAEIDPETVVGMWLFDEGEGEIAGDSTGNNDDMQLQNGIQWVEGMFGKALGLDGTDDVASASVPDAPQGAAVRTVVGWAKSNNTGIKGGIVAYGNVAVNSIFGFLHYGGVWVSQLWGAAPQFDIMTNVAVDTSWHHHAVLYDGENVIHYIDGEEAANEPRNPTTQGTTLIIGAEPDLNDWFNGSVDEVAIFSVALTQDEIISIMTGGLKLGAAVSSADKLTAAWGWIKAQD